MTDRDKERLDRQLDLLEQKLPASVGRFIRRLREPMLRWVRIPLGIVLIVGSVFSFLPVLGLWMAPLGLLPLAEEVPFLRRPIGRALVWAERKWDDRKKRRPRGGP